MRRQREYQKQVDGLFEKRAKRLRSLILEGRKGSPMNLTRHQVDKAVERLQIVAEEGFVESHFEQEFRSRVDKKKRWMVSRGKGRTWIEKRARFKKWYRTRYGHRSCLYMFWAEQRCLYVGQSENGGGRVTHHFDKIWFRGTTRIEVFLTTPKNLPLLECLAIHRYDPVHNRMGAPERKYTPKCPICRLDRHIENELHAIFPLR